MIMRIILIIHKFLNLIMESGYLKVKGIIAFLKNTFSLFMVLQMLKYFNSYWWRCRYHASNFGDVKHNPEWRIIYFENVSKFKIKLYSCSSTARNQWNTMDIEDFDGGGINIWSLKKWIYVMCKRLNKVIQGRRKKYMRLRLLSSVIKPINLIIKL